MTHHHTLQEAQFDLVLAKWAMEGSAVHSLSSVTLFHNSVDTPALTRVMSATLSCFPLSLIDISQCRIFYFLLCCPDSKHKDQKLSSSNIENSFAQLGVLLN